MQADMDAHGKRLHPCKQLSDSEQWHRGALRETPAYEQAYNSWRDGKCNDTVLSSELGGNITMLQAAIAEGCVFISIKNIYICPKGAIQAVIEKKKENVHILQT